MKQFGLAISAATVIIVVGFIPVIVDMALRIRALEELHFTGRMEKVQPIKKKAIPQVKDHEHEDDTHKH